VSFDPDAAGAEQSLSLEEIMERILLVLRKIEKHLSLMTDEELEDDDVH